MITSLARFKSAVFSLSEVRVDLQAPYFILNFRHNCFAAFYPDSSSDAGLNMTG